MGDLERGLQSNDQQEILGPHHFFAAYVFDKANEHETDIGIILQQAGGLGYPVRYWWLSDTMELQGSPDRLIVCVHHPSGSENAGMDLYESLCEKGISWDDLRLRQSTNTDSWKSLSKVLKTCVHYLGNNSSPMPWPKTSPPKLRKRFSSSLL